MCICGYAMLHASNKRLFSSPALNTQKVHRGAKRAGWGLLAVTVSVGRQPLLGSTLSPCTCLMLTSSTPKLKASASSLSNSMQPHSHSLLLLAPFPSPCTAYMLGTKPHSTHLTPHPAWLLACMLAANEQKAVGGATNLTPEQRAGRRGGGSGAGAAGRGSGEDTGGEVMAEQQGEEEEEVGEEAGAEELEEGPGVGEEEEEGRE